MKLIIEVVFATDAMSKQREADIKKAIQEFGETLEYYSGQIVKAELSK